ncbi:MAG: MerR family transcriptional regulator [Oscillospiraceae bacterium]|nr:MerR family transcriptional regulator [Oscillospiraceae bacterium]
MENGLYSSGEFAKLCGVSKDTLSIYGKKGLLKPAVTKENGYQYYSNEQYMTFSLIKLLKYSGLSISEIHEILSTRDGERILRILEKSRLQLAQKQAEIYEMQLAAEKLISSAEKFHTAKNEIKIMDFSEEYLITSDFEASDEGEKVFGNIDCRNISSLDEYIEKRGYQKNVSSAGVIISKDNFEFGVLFPSKSYKKINYKPVDSSLVIKPAGKYACISFSGVKSAEETLCRLRNKIIGKGYSIKGPCYIELIPFSFLLSDENYTGIISARIEE